MHIWPICMQTLNTNSNVCYWLSFFLLLRFASNKRTSLVAAYLFIWKWNVSIFDKRAFKPMCDSYYRLICHSFPRWSFCLLLMPVWDFCHCKCVVAIAMGVCPKSRIHMQNEFNKANPLKIGNFYNSNLLVIFNFTGLIEFEWKGLFDFKKFFFAKA